MVWVAVLHLLLLLPAALGSVLQTPQFANSVTPTDNVTPGAKASRICRPPPPRPITTAAAGSDVSIQRFCLVVGDSVSLGYTTPLSAVLNGTCDVVHAPYSDDGGACDTAYGLQCGPLWLGTSLDGAAAPRYDAIVFNFGLHDTNDEHKDEEARDEFVPLPQYGDNLVQFLSLIRKLQPSARVAWVTSTPMHFDMHLNRNVQGYNRLAAERLVAAGLVNASLDLYAVVVEQCGTPPYYGSKAAPNASHHCPLINDNEEYHYNSAGWSLLANKVGELFKALLSSAERQDGAGSDATSHASSAFLCPDNRTSCPANATCMPDSYSNTKWGCCMMPAAVSCGDSWHCCGAGQSCFANGTYNHLCR